MALTLAGSGGSDDEARATAQAAHDLAVKAAEDAAAADARAARAMTKANAADTTATDTAGKYDTLEQLATSYAQALPASVQDRAALHAAVDALRADLTATQTTLTAVQNALAIEVQARGAAVTSEAATRKAADDALAGRATSLEAAVAALQQLKVLVGFGVANLPVSLAAGATTNVVVTLNRSMGSTVYSVGYGLAGGTSLLGALQATGVVSQTATTVTVAVKNAGLSALVNLSTASLSVVTARDA